MQNQGIAFTNPRRRVGPLTSPKNQNNKAWEKARQNEAQKARTARARRIRSLMLNKMYRGGHRRTLKKTRK